MLSRQLLRAGRTYMPRRYLNLQEYQSKKLMADAGVNVQKFIVVASPADISERVPQFSVDEYVIKAQILAGGRGKGTFDHGFKGGVQLTRSPKEACELAAQMIGHSLVTKQTPPEGVLVQKVMVAEALDIARETYLAIVMDRAFGGPVIVGSPCGGVDIEQVAEETPDAIFKQPVDITVGLSEEQAAKMATNLQFKGDSHKVATEQIQRLYQLFMKVDATQVEINPFGETPDGRVVCFDAKFNFDDSAAFRQRDIFALDDMSEADAREQVAHKLGVNYIALDGDIACLVNGAGLAMATMDIIKLHGGEPANFLDVGGTANEEQVMNCFKLIQADKAVKVILVNIFGGIVNCATIANGIVAASASLKLDIPLVVRLAGTNVDEARAILDRSGLKITTADELEQAAAAAVKAAKQ